MAALAAALALPVVAATACEGDGAFGIFWRDEDFGVREQWRALEVDGLMPDTVPGVRGGSFSYRLWRDTVSVGWWVGCNGVNVRFAAREDSLRYAEGFGTRIGCSDRLLALDARIWDALAASVRYVRRDSLVKFLDATGSTRVSFRVLPDTVLPYGMTPYVPPAP